MPIAESELSRDFVVVDEQATVREARDRVTATGNLWTYVVVCLAGGQYAVLLLSELVEVLQRESGTLLSWMLDAALGDVPGLLAPRASDAVEQAAVETGPARRLARKRPDGRLVVVGAEGQVIGVLVAFHLRGGGPADLDWLYEPGFAEEVHTGAKGHYVLTPEDEAQPPPPGQAEPERRWINAEIEDHDPVEPLQVGEVYTLAFDVDVEARAGAVAAEEFRYTYEPGEQLAELTVQLQSDDFEIYTGPQALRVPRSGKSKGKARFDVEPRHEGEGVINAVFLKDGNFIQLVTLRLHTGATARAGVLAAQSLGRTLDAAFIVQPRDVSLTILNTGTAFQVILSSAVAATATLPITLPQLDQMITQARQELLKIVHLPVGPKKTPVYQMGIDIPPKVNQHALQRLAREGYRLYQRIFYGPAADAQTKRLGDRLREMAQGGTLKIQIFSQHFLLPWPILYMADEYDPQDVDPEMFLGLKHIIEHIPLQQDMQVIGTVVDSQPGLTVSLNVNSDIDQQMGMPLIADQRHYWDEISQKGGVHVIARESRDQVAQALADTSTSDHILYFYCHAVTKALAEEGGPDTSALVLSGDGRLTLEDLSLFASAQKVLSGAPLVFINACESAELSPLFYDGFVPYFLAKGARGVIGTECETPALFAAEWARRFFDRFLAGGPLGQIVLDLRREFYYQHHNLMGLLYALYCDGDTQVVPGVRIA